MTRFSHDPELLALGHLSQAIRNYFQNSDCLEVHPPPIVSNPGMEVHVKAFAVDEFHLHTSPEFAMKDMLSRGSGDIYSLAYSFRDEQPSSTHHPQFLMLEWYRVGKNLFHVMDDCDALLSSCRKTLQAMDHRFEHPIGNEPALRLSVAEVFDKFLGVDLFSLYDRVTMENFIQNEHPDVPLAKGMEWEDLFFLIFLNKIEPRLAEYPAVIIHSYPSTMAAISQIDPRDSRVCQRFELYLKGIEVANCFQELTDLSEQKRRCQHSAMEKKELYGEDRSEPKVLYAALERGLPQSTGIALGVQRLAMAFFDLPSLPGVDSSPYEV